jgi:hypothetical protein
MNGHRISFWKTTLASLGAFVFTMVLAGYWLIAGEIRLPAIAWSLTRPAFFYWALTVLVVVFSLFCLMLAVAGFICLNGDAQQNSC